MSDNDTMNAALKYLRMGFSVIPCNPTMDEEKEKKSFVEWTKYQKAKPTEALIRQWWGKWPKAMVGALTGPVSGFWGVDADTPEANRELEDLIPDTLVTPRDRASHRRMR